MKLYYAPGACSLADHIALIASALPFELEKVDLKSKTTERGQDFRSVNPKGYVPALALDDGQVLTENIAILSYIGSQAPALFPADGMHHWRVLETLAFISTELHKGFGPFFNPAASDAEKDEARRSFARRFALVETQLGDRAFIVGDSLSVADCYLFVMLRWATELAKLDLPAQLTAYYKRLGEDPAVAQALGEEGLA